MFGPFLDKLKQGGFAGMGKANMPALENGLPNKGMGVAAPSAGFVGPMVNQGMKPVSNAGPMGMGKAPAFGFMNPAKRAPRVGPQNRHPNRNRLRSF